MKKWEDVAAALSSLPEFRVCNGIKAASCKEKWSAIVSQVKHQTGFSSGEDWQSGRSVELTDFEKTVIDCIEQVDLAVEERELIKQGLTRLQSELNDVETDVLNKRRRTSSSPRSVGSSPRDLLESSLIRAIESINSVNEDRDFARKRLEIEESKLKMQAAEVNNLDNLLCSSWVCDNTYA